MIGSIDSQHSHKYELFPNPTTDRIEAKSELTIDYIEIYDNTGKFIMVTKRSNINFGKYKNGFYFIKIYSDKANFIEKVIKQ